MAYLFYFIIVSYTYAINIYYNHFCAKVVTRVVTVTYYYYSNIYRVRVLTYFV